MEPPARRERASIASGRGLRLHQQLLYEPESRSCGDDSSAWRATYAALAVEIVASETETADAARSFLLRNEDGCGMPIACKVRQASICLPRRSAAKSGTRRYSSRLRCADRTATCSCVAQHVDGRSLAMRFAANQAIDRRRKRAPDAGADMSVKR